MPKYRPIGKKKVEFYPQKDKDKMMANQPFNLYEWVLEIFEEYKRCLTAEMILAKWDILATEHHIIPEKPPAGLLLELLAKLASDGEIVLSRIIEPNDMKKQYHLPEMRKFWQTALRDSRAGNPVIPVYSGIQIQ